MALTMKQAPSTVKPMTVNVTFPYRATNATQLYSVLNAEACKGEAEETHIYNSAFW
jgi:hypothetical protein